VPGRRADPIVREAWQARRELAQIERGGRVFDAMAAIVLGLPEASFEGQGPMWLEAQAGPEGEFPRLPVAKDAEGLRASTGRRSSAWCGTPGAASGSAPPPCTLRSPMPSATSPRPSASVPGAASPAFTGGVFQNRCSRNWRGWPHETRVPRPAAHCASLQRRRLAYGQVASTWDALPVAAAP